MINREWVCWPLMDDQIQRIYCFLDTIVLGESWQKGQHKYKAQYIGKDKVYAVHALKILKTPLTQLYAGVK